MTTPMKLVPVEPTEEMVEAVENPARESLVYPESRSKQQCYAVAQASPNAGKVSREQVNLLAGAMVMLLTTNTGPNEIVEAMFAALGLEWEGEG